MKVAHLTIDPFTSMPILILKDEAARQALPITIGLSEASAIAAELENIRLSRPQTHDLMRELLGKLSAKLVRIEIYDVRERTYYAMLHLVAPGRKRMQIDARPSDAIALALRTGSPIYVAQKVIDENDKLAAHDMPPELVEGARLTDLLENLTDEEFGKWKM